MTALSTLNADPKEPSGFTQSLPGDVGSGDRGRRHQAPSTPALWSPGPSPVGVGSLAPTSLGSRTTALSASFRP